MVAKVTAGMDMNPFTVEATNVINMSTRHIFHFKLLYNIEFERISFNALFFIVVLYSVLSVSHQRELVNQFLWDIDEIVITFVCHKIRIDANIVIFMV